MLRHIVTVTLTDWTEKQFYIGQVRWDMVREMARRLCRNEAGKRSIIRTVECTDELEFWYRCGLRGLRVQPPPKYASSYQVGLRTGKMKGN